MSSSIAHKDRDHHSICANFADTWFAHRRFDELGKEWRFPSSGKKEARGPKISTAAGGGSSSKSPAAETPGDVSDGNGFWERDEAGNRKWVPTATSLDTNASSDEVTVGGRQSMLDCAISRAACCDSLPFLCSCAHYYVRYS